MCNCTSEFALRTPRNDGVSYRFQLQMPPDLQGQT